VVIEPDCSNLVAKVMDSGNDRSETSALITDIKESSSLCHSEDG
jgi:hypothetical protein